MYPSLNNNKVPAKGIVVKFRDLLLCVISILTVSPTLQNSEDQDILNSNFADCFRGAKRDLTLTKERNYNWSSKTSANTFGRKQDELTVML
jgi:hypothetical protein